MSSAATLRSHRHYTSHCSKSPSPRHHVSGRHANGNDLHDVRDQHRDAAARSRQVSSRSRSYSNHNRHTTDNHSHSLSRSASSVRTGDDAVGIIDIRVGEVIAHRYRVVAFAGQGTFGTVLEVVDTYHPRHEHLAIKVVRAVRRYLESARTEAEILQQIAEKDPYGQSQCLRLISTIEFTHRHQHHVGLISEILGKSLYSFLKHNHYQPYPPSYVKRFAYQLLKAIKFCHSIHLIHTDLKMENVLLADSGNRYTMEERSDGSEIRVPVSSEIRLIDFGGAVWEHEHHTSMVQTRQYRAPEVVLNVGWSYAADMWSVAAICSELASGNLLFATHDDAEHMQLIERTLQQPFPPQMVAKAMAKYEEAVADVSSNGHHHSYRSASSSRPSSDATSSAASLLMEQWAQHAISNPLPEVQASRNNRSSSAASNGNTHTNHDRQGSTSCSSSHHSRSPSASGSANNHIRPSRSPSTANLAHIFDVHTGRQRWPVTAPDKHSIRHVRKQHTLTHLHSNNPELLDLLQKMLQIDPADRITAAEALRHRYFDEIRDEMDELSTRLKQRAIAADEARILAKKQAELHRQRRADDDRSSSERSQRYVANDVRYTPQRRPEPPSRYHRYQSRHDSRSRSRHRHDHRVQQQRSQSPIPARRYDVRDIRCQRR